jgi:hypothetical protein
MCTGRQNPSAEKREEAERAGEVEGRPGGDEAGGVDLEGKEWGSSKRKRRQHQKGQGDRETSARDLRI